MATSDIDGSFGDDGCAIDTGLSLTDDPQFAGMLESMSLDSELAGDLPGADVSEAALLEELLKEATLESFGSGELAVSDATSDEGHTSQVHAESCGVLTAENPEQAEEEAEQEQVSDSDDEDEDVELLQKKVEFLEAQKELLRVRFERARGLKRRGRRSAAKRTGAGSIADLARSTADNGVMRHMLMQQQFMIDNMRAMVSFAPASDVHLSLMTPMESYIHLGADTEERRRTIMRIREKKLDVTCSYLAEKSRSVDMKQQQYFHRDVFERFGKLYHMDYCQVKFDNVQVADVVNILRTMNPPGKTVRCEFGCTTFREVCDTDPAAFKHQRIFSSVQTPTASPVVESNMLILYRDRDDHGRAVYVADSIDQDDLYPYDANHRIRMDTCIGWLFEPYKDGQGVACVVMKRFVLSRCHTHQTRLPTSTKNALHATICQSFAGRLQKIINNIAARGTATDTV